MNWKNNFNKKKKKQEINKESLMNMVLQMDDEILKNIKEKGEQPPETFKHLGAIWKKQEDNSYKFESFIEDDSSS